jgi:hypothetical protein
MVPRDRVFLLLMLPAIAAGCHGKQYARVIKPGQREMVGSHQAGQETFRPLIDEAVGKLVARHSMPPHVLVSAGPELLPPPKMRVCFVGVENKTSEEIGDFKEQIYRDCSNATPARPLAGVTSKPDCASCVCGRTSSSSRTTWRCLPD